MLSSKEKTKIQPYPNFYSSPHMGTYLSVPYYIIPGSVAESLITEPSEFALCDLNELHQN